MSTHLESKDLINAQQMDVAVNGPDGATHLILCTGIANLSSCSHETFTFFVGPQISRRQFVRVIVSGALSRIQAYDKNPAADKDDTELEAHLVSIDANYDDECGQVKVTVGISFSTAMMRVAITYSVSILAELPSY